MNKFAILISLFFSLSANAEFHTLLGKTCNAKPVTLEANERIFVDLSQQVIGFGSIRQTCRLVDFISIVISSSNGTETQFTPASLIGRKSTCSPEIAQYAGPNFQSGIFTAHTLKLQHVAGECSELVYSF